MMIIIITMIIIIILKMIIILIIIDQSNFLTSLGNFFSQVEVVKKRVENAATK